MPEPFNWTAPDGGTITLPKMKHIKAGVLRRYRKLDGIDMVFSILEEVADAATLAKIDDLDTDGLEALAEAWQGDVGVGESSGSSTSSTSTGEPSNTTSAPASPVSQGV
jgi:hypothetical protein